MAGYLLVSIPTGSITVVTARGAYRPLLSFNSNWFDYSLKEEILSTRSGTVSIPTGSITVIAQRKRMLILRGFNSNWFDYS